MVGMLTAPLLDRYAAPCSARAGPASSVRGPVLTYVVSTLPPRPLRPGDDVDLRRTADDDPPALAYAGRMSAAPAPAARLTIRDVGPAVVLGALVIAATYGDDLHNPGRSE